MTREEVKSCICTIKMLQKLAYNIHGVMDVVDADNCKKIIKALEQEPCVSEGVCREDKIQVLDKIRAEIEEERSFQRVIEEYYIATGLRKALEIIDKYIAESEEEE